MDHSIIKLHRQRIKNHCTNISYLIHRHLLFPYSKHWGPFTWPFPWLHDNLTRLVNQYFTGSLAVILIFSVQFSSDSIFELKNQKISTLNQLKKTLPNFWMLSILSIDKISKLPLSMWTFMQWQVQT